jgi:spore maturation protein CgeB
MKFVLFYHSFISCWNHGNAHFLRGIARELVHLDHKVIVYEPASGWSRDNALAEDGSGAVFAEAAELIPGVKLQTYDPATLDLDEAVDGADVVIAHEWNDPALISQLGDRRADGGRFLLLFHDTHHRAITAPEEISRFALDSFDAVLAFGEVLRQVYLDLGWGHRVFTWHEAADVALFKPQPDVPKDTDLIWIGNWGDGERDQELQEFLVNPVVKLGLKARAYGVRYPEELLEQLRICGFEFRGWLANHRAPQAFARARVSMHVPRRPYVEALRGIPTIRVFEALACGIPLVSAPWHDSESLFPDGSLIKARNGAEATAALRLLTHDPDFASALGNAGLRAIRARHTCAHRVEELLAIIDNLKPQTNVQNLPRSGQLERMAEP